MEAGSLNDLMHKQHVVLSLPRTLRIASDVATMIKHRLTPPREEIYTLHRRFNGCFQLAARVGATISAREILLDVYDKQQWHASTETPAEPEAAAAAGA